MAHFLEHMCMKGGQKYSTPYAVSSALDSLGAESNAFTSTEATAYFAKGHPKHFSKMLDVIADVYLRPRLEAEELEKERGVVIEEINLRDDMPMARASHLLNELMYGDQPAGWHTLGTKEVIRSIDQQSMKDFHSRHYNSLNTIVVVAGDVPTKGLREKIESYFGQMTVGRPSKRLKPKLIKTGPKITITGRETDQVHLRLGAYAYPATSKNLPALMVLNSVLSGGMSGRLFQKLREEMGVCYYVSSRVEEHDSYGHLVVAAGVDTSRVNESLQAIVDEMRRLSSELVDSRELKKSKDYLIGNMFLDLETSLGLADFYLEQEILSEVLETPDQKARLLKSVEATDIRRVARSIFKSADLSLSLVGNYNDRSALKKILTF